MSQEHPGAEQCRDELRAIGEARARAQVDLAAAAFRAQAANLSIVEIARLAGVSRPTVYAAMAALERVAEEARAL